MEDLPQLQFTAASIREIGRLTHALAIALQEEALKRIAGEGRTQVLVSDITAALPTAMGRVSEAG